MLNPDYLFEISWEVCNPVGGIYTVLSTRAALFQKKLNDYHLFIGPDFAEDYTINLLFKEDKNLFSDWEKHFHTTEELSIRIGRWDIPGNPIAILVDYTPLFTKKNDIYGKFWELYQVDSLYAYGDYDDSCMFGYATGIVINNFYNFFSLDKTRVIAHFHEWTTAFGLLFVKQHQPSVATVFTTHATTVGRSISGNHKPLYEYMNQYNGNQMAGELNVLAKHSAEKAAAHFSDCFTTVSDVTATECTQLLEKAPDVITPNGFNDSFVPKGKLYQKKQKEARKKLRAVAEAVLRYSLNDDALFIGTSGRYEYKNKGIDVMLDSLKLLSQEHKVQRQVVAFIMLPAHIASARTDIKKKLAHPERILSDIGNHYTTHELYHYDNDTVMSTIRRLHLTNKQEENVKVIFVPSFLSGNDGIFNMHYYDLLIGMDITVFASYYEPWGYTPMESVAFSIPTVTTSLSGFGQWVVSNQPANIENGVAVIPRSDFNYNEVVWSLSEIITNYSKKTVEEITEIRKAAAEIAKKGLWKNFITYYEKAYDIALSKK
jgi:glycogen synthase